MRTLSRLVHYARPLHHIFPEYIVYTLLGIVFGLMNFTLLIPILQLLFEQGHAPVTEKPVFHLSFDYIRDAFNYTFNTIITQHGKFNALAFVCGLVGISILLANVFRYMAVRVLLRLRLRLMEAVRVRLYEKYLQQSLSYHHNQSKGDLLMVMTTEVQEIESSVVSGLQVLLRDPFVVVAYFGILFYWSPQLTLFTLIFLPVTGGIISAITRQLKKLNYFSQEMMSSIISQTDESISGIRQVQSFLAEQLMNSRFRGINQRFSRHSKHLFGKKELAAPISEVLGVLAALTLILFGGYLILNGKSNLGGSGFIAYLALYTQIIQPLKNLSQPPPPGQRAIVAWKKISRVFAPNVPITNPPQPVRKKSFDRELVFDRVSFRYKETRVLQDIRLTIPKGKTVALVGESGSGKSTLADLIPRFYDVEEGAILVDGVNIRNLDLNDLRSLVAIVSQDSFLFNDTVYNNIALGRPDATEAEVEEAARVANAHGFIGQMEEGYNTLTGERGVKLSGGQRQRISIARAVLKNAPILILDEATSALDTESEQLVQEALQHLMKDRTSLVIAHRLSTVRHADEIIVLHRGKMVERGTHDSLLAAQGYYKRLVDLQEVK